MASTIPTLSFAHTSVVSGMPHVAALDAAWEEAAHLADSLDNLLVDCISSPAIADIRAQAEALQRVAHTYRRGIIAAKFMAASGEGWLLAIQSRLQSALEDQSMHAEWVDTEMDIQKALENLSIISQQIGLEDSRQH